MLDPRAAVVAAVVPTDDAIGKLRPLSATQVTLAAGFWADRVAMNGAQTIPAGHEQLKAAGTLHNFSLAASAAREGYRALGIMFDKPFPFLDSDVYKWLEGVAWEIGRTGDRQLAAMADEAIGLVAAAQRPDGYLNTFVQVLAPGTEYADLAWGHELYCIGHLVQAAIAWQRAVGDGRLLAVAERAIASVEAELGHGGREAIDGHPQIEMALVELYRVTGNRRHLDLAQTFIDRRGSGTLGAGRYGRAYWQDHLPVRGAPEVAGHAVRQLYLDCGAVDAAVELGDTALLEVVHGRWRDMVATRTYLTGAVGSRHKDEAFGDPYELPPDRAYAETCAAIASVMLAWRLLLATGDPACADLIERTAYNGVLASLSLDGRAFFYVNPLQRRTHRSWAEAGPDERSPGARAPWYACACCPPNLMRFIGSWSQLLATGDDRGIQVHQYASADIVAGDVHLRVATRYPWSGGVEVTVVGTPDEPWELSLRVPGWCKAAVLRDARGRLLADATTGAGSIAVRRDWRPNDMVTLALEMPVRLTTPDPRVDAVRGCLAIERGPIVYAVETADLTTDVELEDVRIARDATATPKARDDLRGDTVGLSVAASTADGRPLDLPAIPYHLWANRVVGGMRVWIPEVGS